MEYESVILKRLIDTYGVVGNPRYISEIIKEFIVQGKERFPELFTYQADWLAHIDEFGLNPSYTVSYTGQSIYAPNTLEKPVKSAILSGQTKLTDELGNECDYPNRPNTAIGAYINPTTGEETLTDASFRTTYIKAPHETFKVSGKNRWKKLAFYDINKKFIKGIDPTLNSYGDFLVNANSIPSNAEYMRVSGSLSPINNSDVIEQVLEILDTNNSSLYITHLESVKMPVLKATGSNMVNPTDIEVLGCDSYDVDSDGIINVVGDTTGYWARSCIKYTHHLKGNTTYYIYCDGDSTGKIKTEAWINNVNTNKINWNNFYEYTPETDVSYMLKIFLNTNASPFTCSKIRIGIFETSTKPSSYEPFKSNILTVNEDVTLRSNGSVYDELDLLTGKLTQRIDENGEVLSQEIVKTVDLTILDQNGQNVKQLMSFNGGTHFNTGSLEGSPLPSVTVTVETDLEETLRVCSLDGNTM